MPAPQSPVILRADFIAEARTPASIPEPAALEVAVAGRSNVGKSTLLNRLTARKALARVSKTPGRTRGIMFYDVDARFGETVIPMRLVDLPGYGYAKVARDERDSWRRLIEGYVKHRPTLALFLILVDARRGTEDEERQLVEWLETLGVKLQMVVTKVDKLGSSERGIVRERSKDILGPGAPQALPVSGETGEGVDKLWAVIKRAVTT